jgi:hypothetical protein
MGKVLSKIETANSRRQAATIRGLHSAVAAA